MFEWLTDKLYYKTKYNTVKLKRNGERRCYAKSISKLGEQLVESEENKDYYKDRADTRQKTITKQRERLREVEAENIILKDDIKQLISIINHNELELTEEFEKYQEMG